MERGPLGAPTWNQVRLAGATLPANRIAQDENPRPCWVPAQLLGGDRLSRILVRQIYVYLHWCHQIHQVICSLRITASHYLLWVSALVLYIDDETKVRLERCPWLNQGDSAKIIPLLDRKANNWPTGSTRTGP